jgi:SOS response associated peptidase (SRAP)
MTSNTATLIGIRTTSISVSTLTRLVGCRRSPLALSAEPTKARLPCYAAGCTYSTGQQQLRCSRANCVAPGECVAPRPLALQSRLRSQSPACGGQTTRCGRFARFKAPSVYAALFKVDSVPDAPPSFNVAPTQAILAVRTEDDHRACVLLRWSLVPSWSKDGMSFINARGESVATKPTSACRSAGSDA